jgi:hypothetical protein
MGILQQRDDINSFARDVKFNLPEGRATVIERYQDDYGRWGNRADDITQSFKAVVDLKNLRHGYGDPGAAPQATRPRDDDMDDQVPF